MAISHTALFTFGPNDWLENTGDILCTLTRCWNKRQVTYDESYTITPIANTWKHTALKVLSIILFPLTLLATLFGTLAYHLSTTRKEKINTYVINTLTQLIYQNDADLLENVKQLLKDHQGQFDLNTPDADDDYPLIYAATYLNDEETELTINLSLLRLLLKHGANPLLLNSNGDTTLTAFLKASDEHPVQSPPPSKTASNSSMMPPANIAMPTSQTKSTP